MHNKHSIEMIFCHLTFTKEKYTAAMSSDIYLFGLNCISRPANRYIFAQELTIQQLQCYGLQLFLFSLIHFNM